MDSRDQMNIVMNHIIRKVNAYLRTTISDKDKENTKLKVADIKAIEAKLKTEIWTKCSLNLEGLDLLTDLEEKIDKLTQLKTKRKIDDRLAAVDKVLDKFIVEVSSTFSASWFQETNAKAPKHLIIPADVQKVNDGAAAVDDLVKLSEENFGTVVMRETVSDSTDKRKSMRAHSEVSHKKHRLFADGKRGRSKSETLPSAGSDNNKLDAIIHLLTEIRDEHKDIVTPSLRRQVETLMQTYQSLSQPIKDVIVLKYKDAPLFQALTADNKNIVQTARHIRHAVKMDEAYVFIKGMDEIKKSNTAHRLTK